MAQAKHVLTKIARMLEQQGCEITCPKNAMFRAKTPAGRIINMHASPRNREGQIKQIRKDVLANGLEWTL